MEVSVFVPVYNEEDTVGQCLEGLISQKENGFHIKEILVISSGSTDRTDEIVNDFSKRDSRIVLLREEERLGKAHAINKLLSMVPRGRICVMISGDVKFKDAFGLKTLVQPFSNPKIGMSSTRPIPVNSQDTMMGKVAFLLWELRHRVSLISPKTGEAVAFRKVFEALPEDELVDEAYIEWEIERHNLKIVYCPDSIVLNRGPENVSDFIKQRKRIYIGHKLLEKRLKYKGSTFDIGLVLSQLVNIIRERSDLLLPSLVLLSLEAFSRIQGRIDLLMGRYDKHGRWDMVKSSKRGLDI